MVKGGHLGGEEKPNICLDSKISETKRKKKMKQLSSDNENENAQIDDELEVGKDSGLCEEERKLLDEDDEVEINKGVDEDYWFDSQDEGEPDPDDENADRRRNQKRKRLAEEAARADKRGVCYLSRIPPHMDPLKLRQILSRYGEIQRIYLVPKGSAAQIQRKKPGGGRRGKDSEEFTEGWVEFTKKSVAKRVANMLNGEPIGGRKKSSFYYDLWNIKYLSKFKWDNLTEEIAYKCAVREQKLALELSAAKKERDFYLSKVDKSRALTSIEERINKKQKVQQGSGANNETPVIQQPFKVVRQFRQTQPVTDNVAKRKPGLSKDVLAGVFG